MISTEQAVSLAQTYYGITGSAKSLPGELDFNFHISDEFTGQYVIKIHGENSSLDVLDLQNQALLHLATNSPELSLPRLVASRNDQHQVIWNESGAGRPVRVLSWLEGTLWSDGDIRNRHTVYELGQFLGRLDQGLADFDHPAKDRDFGWDMRKAHRHLDSLAGIQDSLLRQQVESVLVRFQKVVLPILEQLPTQVIHNDANDNNIVLDKNTAIKGLIDFGDMVLGHRVTEIAVAGAYLMCEAADPAATLSSLVSGYHAVNTLSESELAVIYDLCLTRMAMSVCMAVRQSANDPENQYLLVSQKPFRKLLARLENENSELVLNRLRDACGLTPCPAAPGVLNWLQAHRAIFGPVLDSELLSPENLVVIDLAARGTYQNQLAAMQDTRGFTDFIFTLMKDADARVGVGRYMERRGVYQSDDYNTINPDERRDLHLGIDLFVGAGTPVYAPLDGVVEGIANNHAAYDFGPTVILRHEPQPGVCFWTLYGHLDLDTLGQLSVGQPVIKGDCIGWIGDYPINGDWPPHTHFQVMTSLLGMGTDVHGVGSASSSEVWESLCPDPNLVLNLPVDCRAPLSRQRDALLERRQLRIGRSLSLSYHEPLKIVKGQMQYLFDEQGRRYLDLVNNVCHVGHCHPRVVAAGQKQMQVLNTNTRYLHDHVVDLANRLVVSLPDPLSVCFFVNSGSEANDLALRLARTYTGALDVLVLEQAYHGNLGSLVDISPYKFDGPGGSCCPSHTWVCELPDTFRGAYRGVDAALQYARSVQANLVDLQRMHRRPAAFIAESLGGVSGQLVLPPGYLQTVYPMVRDAGGVCIADEVQVGLGRMGSNMWGFQTQNVVPDIVTIGKPLGNGHPLAAVVTTAAIADAFNNGMEYFNTFGGNPVSSAIGSAVLDTITIDRLMQNAMERGDQLKNGLQNLSEVYGVIGDVRGIGLFVGAELVEDRQSLMPASERATRLVEHCKREGILLSTDGKFDNVLKIKPPMCIDADDIDRFLDVLNAGLGKL